MYTPARGSKCLISVNQFHPDADRIRVNSCPPGALYLNESLRERTTGAESKAASAPGVSAEGWSRRLGITERRRGEPRTGHSAAANAESLDRALSPASSPVTSISAFRASGRRLPTAPSRRRSLGGRMGMGWGEEAGRSVGAGKKTRPLQARARSEARRLFVVDLCSREGACPFFGRQGPCGSASTRGCEEGKRVLRGAGSTCLRIDGGSLCSEETQALEGGCETEQPVSVRLDLFICLLPRHLQPLMPAHPVRKQTAASATATRRGRLPRAGQAGRAGCAPAGADCFVGLVRRLAEGKPSSEVL
ncbi:LOW QUALITY PROTEIN: hypothetical protein AAY473_037037, partial [Plecturocebus cupreus]